MHNRNEQRGLFAASVADRGTTTVRRRCDGDDGDDGDATRTTTTAGHEYRACPRLLLVPLTPIGAFLSSRVLPLPLIPVSVPRNWRTARAMSPALTAYAEQRGRVRGSWDERVFACPRLSCTDPNGIENRSIAHLRSTLTNIDRIPGLPRDSSGRLALRAPLTVGSVRFSLALQRS